LTIILDLPVEAGLSRAASRGSASDIYERRTKEFHNSVREGFLDIAAKNPTRCYLVNADREASVVAASIRQAIDKRFG